MAIIKDPSYNIEVPVIANGTTFKTDWKPRILFSNTVPFTGLIYGMDASYATNPNITHWNTLSTKDTNKLDASVNSLKWDATATYVETTLDTNNTLYNKYYKQDLELNLDNNAYMVTANMLLDANDLYDLDFRNTIFIGSRRIGESTYKLNSIKNYKAGTLAEVELIKINAPITPATPFTSTNSLYLSYTGTSSSASGSGSSSGSGSGGSGSTTLAGLADVEITDQQDGDSLVWDSATNRWINEIGGGGVSKAYVDSSLSSRDASIIDLRANKVSRYGDTMTGSLEMTNGSRLFTDYIDSSMQFFSGFAGSGYQLGRNVDEFDLTVDNLTVRKQMKIYELQVAKISAINGGFIVSSANGKVYDVSGNYLIFDENDGHNLIQFVNNDYIRAQEYDSTGTKYYLGQVVGSPIHSSVLGMACIEVTNLSGTCWSGADVVQVGNSTDTTRQNIIYMTASDDGNPYIDILGGVNTNGSFAGKTKVRTGNLEGITDLDFSPNPLTGYGLYANGDVYLKGNIQLANQYPASKVAVTGQYPDIINNPSTLAMISTADNSILVAAKADASTSIFKIGEIASDAKITPVEKLTLKPIWDAIVLEATPTTGTIPARAISLGVPRANFESAYTTLYGYVITSLNTFGDMTATTNITRATWDTYFKNYYNEKEKILSDIAAKAATLSTWAGVSGSGKPADNATVGATWGTNLYSIPSQLGTPSGTGLFLSSTYMGYYTSGQWKTYMDNAGNLVLGNIAGGGAGLSWNQGTSVLNIKGAISITSGDVPWTTVSGASKPADNATVGATWGTNLSNMPGWTSAPSGSGLFIDASYFGYYSGGTWQSYIDWLGNAKFVSALEIGTTTISDDSRNQNIGIKGNKIWENSVADNNGRISINLKGYQGGTSYYRNTVIGNGKNTPIISVDGAASGVTIEGSLTIQGTSKSNYIYFPKLSTTTMLSIGAYEGMMVYNTTVGRFAGCVKVAGNNEWWTFAMDTHLT